MLLERKNAIIYGGGGAIGSAVARAFSREGARVYLAGRTLEKLERTTEVIRAGGGTRRRLSSMRLMKRPSTPMRMPWPAMAAASTSRST
jgi:NAD(P)-dependent dehydrogenase (short-subunit alcohol dehydrogenase family)